MRLMFERKPVKFAAARLAGTLAPGGTAAVDSAAATESGITGRVARTSRMFARCCS